MSKRNSIKSVFNPATTWALIKDILEASSDGRHNWNIEEFQAHELIRATLEPKEELKREIVLNVFIMELSRDVLEQTTNYDVYKKHYWVEVRIDEDVYPYFKRKEKPEPIIAKTRQNIIDAITPRRHL